MRLTVLALLFCLLHATSARAAKLLAVLPLDTTHTDGKMSPAAQASIEEMLRDVATNALPSEGWTVLTGETMLQVLQDNGVDGSKCGDQTCHLSMARELKAEKFLSGAVQYVEGEFTASIRLIDSGSGRILSSERARGMSVRALRDDFEGKAIGFFVRSGMLDAKKAPVATPAPVAAPTPAPPLAPPPEPAPPKAAESFIRIPGGTFSMGTEDPEFEDTKPVTRVTLSPFQLSRLEASVADYRRCVAAGKCTEPVGKQDNCNWKLPNREDHPINCVNWAQAKAFCEWQGGRLPTEAEWEFAARGTEGRKFPWGNEDATPTQAPSIEDTVPVDSFPGGASPFGVILMGGNVWEWVEDRAGTYPGGSVTNPKNNEGESHVCRGGSGGQRGRKATAMFRWVRGGDAGRTAIGFRCAR